MSELFKGKVEIWGILLMMDSEDKRASELGRVGDRIIFSEIQNCVEMRLDDKE